MASSEQPRFFLDRGLGAVSIATALRASGFAVETMNDRYGATAGERIGDAVWIRDATIDGFVLLHKDKRVRYKAPEKEALIFHRARSFALANGRLTGAEMVAWYTRNMPDMLAVIARRAGPYFYHVHADQIVPKPLSWDRR